MTVPVDDLSDLEPGVHLCRFYEDERDLARGAAAFVGCGLAAGHRVLYVTNDRATEKVEASLQVHGVPVERALAGGQLVVRSFQDVYGEDLPRLEQVENDYRALNALATADGLTGLRVAAEMGDAVSRFGSLDHLLHWEALSSRWQRDTGVSTVCQYDRRRLASADMARVAATHTGQAPAHAVPPLAGFYVDAHGLRIVGEIDLSNAGRLLRVVDARLSVQPRLQLDLAGLTFVDIGTLEALFGLVHARRGVQLVVCNASPMLRRCLDLAGLRHPRVMVL
ncbi:MAG: MEDS domain-containing protein [Nocardioidaceae bacterium]